MGQYRIIAEGLKLESLKMSEGGIALLAVLVGFVDLEISLSDDHHGETQEFTGGGFAFTAFRIW